MKAIQIKQYGDISELHLEDIATPSIKSDELLIRVHAAGINPVDSKIRSGLYREVMPRSLPAALGWDVCGEVVETGDAVKKFNVGDNVFAYLNLLKPGAYAEYVAVQEHEVAHKPHNLNHVDAAAVPLAALTAWQALIDHAQLKANQRVLIHAAAGGVGHFAVQIAKSRGAYVIGTASAHNRDFLEKLGVDEFIDYHAAPFETTVKPVDIVLGTVSGDTQARSFKVLNKDGILVSIVRNPDLEQLAATNQRRVKFFVVQPNSEQLNEVRTLIEANRLKPSVSTVLPLTEAQKAHQLIESGRTRGKIVLAVR